MNFARLPRLIAIGFFTLFVLLMASIVYVRFMPIHFTPYMLAERVRLGHWSQDWVPLEDVSKNMPLAIMAGEDAYFCTHYGVDWVLLQELVLEGAQRGGSTITQQVVKNLWLWQGHSQFSRYFRKAVEIPLASFVDRVYPKARIMELYLNIAEFDTGVFGIEAASWHHFQKPAKDLSLYEAALLASVLPNPKAWSAVPPDAYVSKRAKQIEREMGEIRALGLDGCLPHGD